MVLEEEGRAAAHAGVVASLDCDLFSFFEDANRVARHAVRCVFHAGGGRDEGLRVQGDRCDRVLHSVQSLGLAGGVEIPYLRWRVFAGDTRAEPSQEPDRIVPFGP